MAGNFMTIISVSMHHVVHIRADVILRRGDVFTGPMPVRNVAYAAMAQV